MWRFILVGVLAALFAVSCTKSYEEQLANPIAHGGQIWQGYFEGHNGKPISMRLGIRNDRPGESFIEGYLVSGTETHRKYMRVYNDSMSMKGGMHSMFLGKFEGDSILSGVLEAGINRIERRTKFVLVKTDGPRFEPIADATMISPTGTWVLDFGVDSLPFTLRYDMRRMRNLDLYRSNDTIIGSGYVSSEGKQGLDGVMTKDGFKMVSYHHSEPFLMEAVFEDENNFTAIITSVDDTYEVKATRKNQIKEDTEFSTSVFVGFILFLKAFFRL